MKVTVKVQIDDGQEYSFEGEEKDAFKRDAQNILTAAVPQLQLKFGDSGNIVQVPLRKVKNG